MSTKNGKKKQPGSRKRGGKTALIVLAAIAALALVAVGAWKLLVVPPDVSGNNGPGAGEQDVTTPAPDDSGAASESEGESEDLNGRKKDYFTFVLLGKDTGGGGNTDTMLLVSYDVPGGTMDLVSIPRDTMINVPWNIKKINAVFASSRGVTGLKEELGHLTGVTPDFYVAIEWEAIGEIVDALDGVWFDVPYNMDYDDPYQDLYIHQEKGYRLLSGDDAMQVIRWRKNNGEEYGIGDSGRQQVQQDFLKAVAKQCLQIQNWTKVSAFAEIFFKNVETDIPWNNVLWFAQKAMGLDIENINFHSLPGNDQGWYYTPSLGGNLAYFFADPAGIVELVNAHFNPFNRDITEEDLQIVYKNKDASLGVTNGELADPQMAIPSVKPPSPPKTENEDDTSAGENDGEISENPEDGSDEPVLPPEGDETEMPDAGGDSSGNAESGEVTESGEGNTETGDGNEENGEAPVSPAEGTETPPETDGTESEKPEDESDSETPEEPPAPSDDPEPPPETGTDDGDTGTQPQ